MIPDDVEQLTKDWDLYTHFVLSDKPTIVVVGAYQGKLMELLLNVWPDAFVAGYEPQEWAYLRALTRLEPYGSTHRFAIYNYAIGVGPEQHAEMGEFFTDACSFVNVGPNSREHGFGRLVNAKQVFDDYNHIDLMIMNIEGYEFTLLPYLDSIGALDIIDRLAVQWHVDLAPGLSEGAMNRAIIGLADRGLKLEVDWRPEWTYHVRL